MACGKCIPLPLHHWKTCYVNEGAESVPQERCTKDNVYNLLRGAAPVPEAQRLDFDQLHNMMPAAKRPRLARGCVRELHCANHHSMNLSEVAVLNVRFTNLAQTIAQEQQGGLAPSSGAAVDGID